MIALFKECEVELTLAQMTRDVNFFEMWKEILAAHPKMINDSPILIRYRGRYGRCIEARGGGYGNTWLR